MPAHADGGRRRSAGSRAGGARPSARPSARPGGAPGGQQGSGSAGPPAAPGHLLAIVDLLGRRHTLGIFWCLRGGSSSFRALAAKVGAPQSQLSQRVRELREAGLVEVDEVGEYRLTSHGRRLLGVVEPLAAWAESWAALSPRQRMPRGSTSQAADEPD
ncbi:winged helix-turn-helix transcriptional regulator [Parafrankia elaeagni]|uniref:winged helix-turn-helix transcriptional regulator n=1 Tax=Parafrankia elaeagni TaxID=222534 RepID=UPI000366E65D|nr:helix-turn-helix domain-containing protein [Parafrankia elaeagni]